ncbi:MAG: hypothetical protein WAN89_02720 [Lawsonella sp.]
MLNEEQTRALLQAVIFPDVEQDMPLIMPPPVARQFGRHILDAVNGIKTFDDDTNKWVRSEDAAPPMSSKRLANG